MEAHTQIHQRLWQHHSCETAKQGSVGVDVVRAGAADCGSPIKRIGASPSWPPCCAPTCSSARLHPPHPTLTPAEPACLPHVSPRNAASPPLAPKSRINRQGFPSAKENIITPLRKTRQVKCGLEWRSGTTFACELHNCYGLQELKPLIRTTWWICHSVFEHEMETNFQSQSILRHRGFISAIHDVHFRTQEQLQEMPLDSSLAFQ